MSPLRWALVALLVASTALFAVGVIAVRSDADTHSSGQTTGSGDPEISVARLDG